MRIEPPCRLDDAPCPSRIARLRQQPAGKRSRRYEARCKLRRLHRKLPGAVAVRILRGDGLRGQQDRALALIRSLIEQPALEVVLEPMQRARPVARNTAKLEHGVPRPSRHGVVPRRLLRMHECGRGVVAPTRLDEQAVQAEQAGILAPGHLLEAAHGPGAIAGKLGCLSLQEKRERLARSNTACLLHELPRRNRIARADRHQPPGHRAIAARAAPRAQLPSELTGRAQQRTRPRPQRDRKRGDHDHRHGQNHDRGLDLATEPVDGDIARAVGEPFGADRQQSDQRQIDDDPDHCAALTCSARRAHRRQAAERLRRR